MTDTQLMLLMEQLYWLGSILSENGKTNRFALQQMRALSEQARDRNRIDGYDLKLVLVKIPYCNASPSFTESDVSEAHFIFEARPSLVDGVWPRTIVCADRQLVYVGDMPREDQDWMPTRRIYRLRHQLDDSNVFDDATYVQCDPEMRARLP